MYIDKETINTPADVVRLLYEVLDQPVAFFRDHHPNDAEELVQFANGMALDHGFNVVLMLKLP